MPIKMKASTLVEWSKALLVEHTSISFGTNLAQQVNIEYLPAAEVLKIRAILASFFYHTHLEARQKRVSKKEYYLP